MRTHGRHILDNVDTNLVKMFFRPKTTVDGNDDVGQESSNDKDHKLSTYLNIRI